MPLFLLLFCIKLSDNSFIFVKSMIHYKRSGTKSKRTASSDNNERLFLRGSSSVEAKDGY